MNSPCKSISPLKDISENDQIKERLSLLKANAENKRSPQRRSPPAAVSAPRVSEFASTTTQQLDDAAPETPAFDQMVKK